MKIICWIKTRRKIILSKKKQSLDGEKGKQVGKMMISKMCKSLLRKPGKKSKLINKRKRWKNNQKKVLSFNKY